MVTNKTLYNNIMEFQPQNGNWLELESLFEQVFCCSDPYNYYSSIFNLFERFADEDGTGVFWSALHGMEAFGKYEDQLVHYFSRFPSHMTKIMLKRLRNSGKTHAGGVCIELLIGKNC